MAEFAIVVMCTCDCFIMLRANAGGRGAERFPLRTPAPRRRGMCAKASRHRLCPPLRSGSKK